MPQMAPLMWLCLYFYFLLALMLILTINHFISPYQKISIQSYGTSSPQALWKL
nr:ATP synthase F0 subunit 8 [Carcinus maenas]